MIWDEKERKERRYEKNRQEDIRRKGRRRA
jgi:hypothetical protein